MHLNGYKEQFNLSVFLTLMVRERHTLPWSILTAEDQTRRHNISDSGLLVGQILPLNVLFGHLVRSLFKLKLGTPLIRFVVDSLYDCGITNP